MKDYSFEDLINTDELKQFYELQAEKWGSNVLSIS